MIRYFWPSDDEQLAGQWTDTHFDEDASWWVGAQRAGATVALAAVLATTTLATTLATSVFSQNQDDPAGSLFTQPATQEEYWQNPTPPVNWPAVSAFTDDEVHPTFVRVFTPDDGDWARLVAPVPATNFVQLPLNETEIFPQFPAANNPVDDSAIWAPNNPPWEPNWTLLFFLEDGSAVPVFQYDEDFWSPVIPPQNWSQPQQPFAEGDENSLVIQFVAEDVVWQQLVPPVQASLTWPQPFSFEQHEPVGTLVAFTDEIFWQNPTPPVPDKIWRLDQFAFEQTDATGSLTLILDDGFQPNFVPPVPDSLKLLQPFIFEPFEPAGSLYYLRDEDFWINPVAPVAGYPVPRVFTDDDVTFSQPITAQDEDFWSMFRQPWVQPVPSSMVLNFPYQPDPEEIPAGSLVPFVPPPPPFCPLPPSGPDADVSMSVFGGVNSPTKVLFCRICNSGNPLIVRADYAIWCQDCCAFVSKQDTYMGTTRAPGKFKDVF